MHAHFEGRLTTRDAKRYIKHRFEMPPGARAVEITFSFAPVQAGDIKNLLTLTLFDAHGETARGFRGAGHRDGTPGAEGTTSLHHVYLSATAATPGYIPGPLPPGTWTVEIDTHMIMPGPPLTYALAVATVEEAAVVDAATPKGEGNQTEGEPAIPRPATGKPGWYRGDLHTHSVHSDAEGFTVADLADAATGAGLDFLFLTDHNTTAGLAAWPATSPVMLGSGLELTTYWGHALCLGTRDWVDWRIAPGSGTMARIAAELQAAGGVFVIAHPGSVGDPACTGCAWRFGEMMPAGAGFVEVL
jgi:hypothetical protein